MQVDPMGNPVRGVVAFSDPAPKRQFGQKPPGTAVMNPQCLWLADSRLQALGNSEARENAHSVRPELDTCASLRWILPALEHLTGQTPAGKSDGKR